jgi:hypothetical protein
MARLRAGLLGDGECDLGREGFVESRTALRIETAGVIAADQLAET